MIRKKLLITGGSGYLGQHICRQAAIQHEVYATYHSHPLPMPRSVQIFQLDITNRNQVLQLVDKLHPDAIIHAAAVNPGQQDEAALFPVNVSGSRHVAEAAAQCEARLIHISTDMVHDGRHAPYNDDTPPTPINLYGRSKAEGEAMVEQFYPQATIVRTSLIYGLNTMDRGTAGFVKRLKSGKQLTLFADVLRQPIWVTNLSEALLNLIMVNFAKTLNIAGRQALSRADFGSKMLRWWNIDYEDRTVSGKAAEVSNNIPLDLRLSVATAEKLLGLRFVGVDEVLSAHQVTTIRHKS